MPKKSTQQKRIIFVIASLLFLDCTLGCIKRPLSRRSELEWNIFRLGTINKSWLRASRDYQSLIAGETLQNGGRGGTVVVLAVFSINSKTRQVICQSFIV